MLTALVDITIALAPGFLTLLFGSAIWPASRRLGRLEKLCDLRAKLTPDTPAYDSLDHAVEALARRVLRDTIGVGASRNLVSVAVAVAMACLAGVTVYVFIADQSEMERSIVQGGVAVVAALLGLGLSFISSRATAFGVTRVDVSSAIKAYESTLEDERSN